MAQVRLNNIRKTYGSHVALKDINLDIASGAFFTLLGPSGCGKTTLLRAIAGFHIQDAGEIFVGDESIGHLSANKRHVGMVFQDYAVFPHLSVYDNVAFGLVQQKVSASDISQRVADILSTVQLDHLAQRMPHQLSGGQQQRVGLARAMVIRPKVLLMDEPLSNLDAKLRVDLRRDIRQLQQKFGITTVYVTHDQEEALAISDQICVMFDGVAQQVDSPWAIYNQPANRFVAEFVGANNFMTLDASRSGASSLMGQPHAAPDTVQKHGPCIAAIRPEKLRVNAVNSAAGLYLGGTLRQSMFTGRDLQLSIEVPGHGLLEALTAPNEAMVAVQVGESVRVGMDPADIQYFALGDVGRRLA